MQLSRLHKAQASILYTLRHNTAARYTALMQPTGLESDMFKFHLGRLTNLGYVEKQPLGTYVLTASGKEFANNLAKATPTALKQPKISVAIVAMKRREGSTEYLFHRRQRNPFFDFWGFLSGPVQWDESFEETAEREFKKQTGMTAQFEVKAFSRQTDYQDESEAVLEDKIFVIVSATNITGNLQNAAHIGNNQWMTLRELEQQDKFFPATRDFIQILEANTTYSSRKYSHPTGRY